jgi:hypothetical protein
MVKSKGLMVCMTLIGVLLMPHHALASETDRQDHGGWRCDADVLTSSPHQDGEMSARGWFCPWCSRYALPGPGREGPETGCMSCDPHYAPFHGAPRFSGNQAILIVEGLLRKSDMPDLTASSIVEQEHIYEARLINASGIHVDTLHIHKANGWVRSFPASY